MNRSQREAIKRKVREIEDAFVLASPADQLFTRTSIDGNIVTVEGSIENPVDGYESGWFWLDAFGVGERGRIL